MPVVQIKKHRGTFRGGHHQILKFSKNVRTNRVAFVICEQPGIAAFVGVDIEMIEPEIGELLFKLPFAVNRAIDFRHRKFSNDALGSVNLLICEHRTLIRIAAVVPLLAHFRRLVVAGHIFELLHHRVL